MKVVNGIATYFPKMQVRDGAYHANFGWSLNSTGGLETIEILDKGKGYNNLIPSIQWKGGFEDARIALCIGNVETNELAYLGKVLYVRTVYYPDLSAEDKLFDNELLHGNLHISISRFWLCYARRNKFRKTST